MDEQIKRISQEVYDKNQGVNQYGVSSIAFHTHNSADSNRISAKNLTDKNQVISYTLFGTQAATSGNYSTFFTAPYPMTVSQITEVHAVLGTDGSDVTLQVDKLTGTTAPGGATAVSLLTTPFSLKSTINTVVTGVLSVVVGAIQLNTGDRIALHLTGTPTSVANVTITLVLNY